MKFNFLYVVILLAILSYNHIISSNLKIAERQIVKLQREIKTNYFEIQRLKDEITALQFRNILWAREGISNDNKY